MLDDDNPAPGTTGLASNITIHNNSPEKVVLFRVQTTSPLSYRVKPSHGKIGPDSSMTVHIALAVESRKVDKFLLKWVAGESGSEGDFNDLFVMGGRPEELRLKCVFPDSIPAILADGSETAAVSDHADMKSVSPAASQSPIQPDRDDDIMEDADQLRQKLKEALAKNELLQKQVTSLQMSTVTQRPVQRDVDTGDSTVTGHESIDHALQLATQGNIPPVLVALIALFAFLLGLLF